MYYSMITTVNKQNITKKSSRLPSSTSDLCVGIKIKMSTNNEEQVILESKYSPPDFFEKRYVVEEQDYKIEIDNGFIKITFNPDFYDSLQDGRMEFHEKITDLFLGAQIINFKRFSLTKPSMHRLHPDGRKDITIFPEPIVCKITVSDSVDIIITDKDGNIVEDTKSQRINSRKKFSELSVKFRRTDQVAASILESFNTAVNDPPNEFIHLFEIIESLCDRFGNEKKLREALGVSKTYIGKLHRLANTEPVTQGRHRGKNPGNLRTAGSSEKQKAREVAQNLIQRYLEYLDKIQS